MSVLNSILAEELNRIESLRKKMLIEIADSHQGAISVKRKGMKDYTYRAYRKNDKVVTDYIGPADSRKAVDLAFLIRKRQALSLELKAVSRDIAQIRSRVGSGENQQIQIGVDSKYTCGIYPW